MKKLTEAQHTEQPHNFLESHNESGCQRWSDLTYKKQEERSSLSSARGLQKESGSPASLLLPFLPSWQGSQRMHHRLLPEPYKNPIWGHVPCIPASTHHHSLPPLAMGPAASSGLLATRHPAVLLLSTSVSPREGTAGLSLSWGHCTHRGQMEAKQRTGASLHIWGTGSGCGNLCLSL